MHQLYDSKRLTNEAEYRNAIAEFDRLWSAANICGNRGKMEQLIRLIEAYELSHEEGARLMRIHG